jgi:hypothetical protein
MNIAQVQKDHQTIGVRLFGVKKEVTGGYIRVDIGDETASYYPGRNMMRLGGRNLVRGDAATFCSKVRELRKAKA